MTHLRALVYASTIALVTMGVAPSPAQLAGRFAGVSAGAQGTVVQIEHGGSTSSIIVPADVLVRERAAGGSWTHVSLAALKPQEPVRVTLDAAGRATEIDAEYGVADTRAVTVRDDYLIGTDGVARRLVGAAAAVASTIPLGAYVELRTDPATGDAFDASVSSHPFAQAASNAPAVAVTFSVQVPVNTPPGSTVYIATNQQRWMANAIRLSPQPGNRWSATIPLAAGTTLQYKYTRGSWSTGERDASGADIANRTLTVRAGAKTQAVDDVVVRWADLPS